MVVLANIKCSFSECFTGECLTSEYQRPANCVAVANVVLAYKRPIIQANGRTSDLLYQRMALAFSISSFVLLPLIYSLAFPLTCHSKLSIFVLLPLIFSLAFASTCHSKLSIYLPLIYSLAFPFFSLSINSLLVRPFACQIGRLYDHSLVKQFASTTIRLYEIRDSNTVCWSLVFASETFTSETFAKRTFYIRQYDHSRKEHSLVRHSRDRYDTDKTRGIQLF